MNGPEPRPPSAGSRRWWIAGLAIAALVVVGAALLASSDPDGLEWVAGEQGFIGRARDAILSILPGYTVPGLEGGTSTIVAGLLGIAIVVIVVLVVGRLVVRRPR